MYRPAIVVGHSKTGEMDKVDGPYYFFKAIQKIRHALPEWVPLLGIEVGWTNIVPVDYVAAAMDHIAHQPDLDGRAFHLVDPKGMRAGDAMNTFARAAHAPQMAIRIDKRMTDMLPKGVLSMVMQLPTLKDIRRGFLADFGIPDSVLEHIGLTAKFDARDTAARARGLGHRAAAAGLLRGQALGLLGAQPRSGPVQGPLVRGRRQRQDGDHHRRVLGHRRGGGDEDRPRRRHPDPRRPQRGEARGDQDKIERAGGTAYTYSCDIADPESVDAFYEQVFNDHAAIDMLVNNAGRSIRRSIALSYDRMHDFERTIQLNYLGAIRLIIRLLPHMRERKTGHIVNVSSIGVQTNPPRFSAYVASKAALDAFTRVVSSSETIGDGVTFTTIHMPLVQDADDRPDEDLRLVPDDHAGGGRGPRLRGDPGQAEAAQHEARHVRRGRLRARAEGRRPDPAHGLQGVPGLRRPPAARRTPGEKASGEAVALAHLMRGVHW